MNMHGDIPPLCWWEGVYRVKAISGVKYESIEINCLQKSLVKKKKERKDLQTLLKRGTTTSLFVLARDQTSSRPNVESLPGNSGGNRHHFKYLRFFLFASGSDG